MRIERPSDEPATLVIPWPDRRAWRKFATRAVLVALLIYVAYLVRPIWVPLALAFLLALVLDPIVDRLETRGWSRSAGAVFIYALFLALIVVTGLLILPQVSGQVEEIRDAIALQFPDPSPKGIKESLIRIGFHEDLARPLAHAIYNFQSNYSLHATRAVQMALEFASNVIWIIIVPIVGFYALRDFHLILAKGLLLVPKRKRDVVQTAVAEITSVFARYMRAVALLSSMNGLATWLLLLALGTNGSLVLGLVAGVLYSVPYIGAIVTTSLIAVVSFLQGGLEYMLLATGLSWLLHQVIFDYMIAPRVLGGRVGLHPILVIVALLVGNLLLGLLGMILAVPIAACIQIGVLAIEPKLREEVDLTSNGDSLEQIADDTREAHLEGATEELHRTVAEAVENIEEKLEQSNESSAPLA